MPVAADLRRHFIAHELGRYEGRHPSITFWPAIFFLLGTAGVYIVRNSSYSWARSVGITGILCLLALTGGASLLARYTTMWFEWEADRRAGRMVGVQAMLDGIDLVIPLRQPVSNAYYINKKSRLQGKPSSFPKPPLR